jgi:hypothetical protein
LTAVKRIQVSFMSFSKDTMDIEWVLFTDISFVGWISKRSSTFVNLRQRNFI